MTAPCAARCTSKPPPRGTTHVARPTNLPQYPSRRRERGPAPSLSDYSLSRSPSSAFALFLCSQPRDSLNTTFHGLPWPSMTVHGFPWPSMAFHDRRVFSHSRDSSAYNHDGSLRHAFFVRLARILHAADALGSTLPPHSPLPINSEGTPAVEEMRSSPARDPSSSPACRAALHMHTRGFAHRHVGAPRPRAHLAPCLRPTRLSALARRTTTQWSSFCSSSTQTRRSRSSRRTAPLSTPLITPSTGWRAKASPTWRSTCATSATCAASPRVSATRAASPSPPCTGQARPGPTASSTSCCVA